MPLRQLLFVALMAVAVAAIAGHERLWPPITPQNNASESGVRGGPAYKGDKNRPAKSWWEPYVEEPVAFATILLAGVTTVLAASTAVLCFITARAMKQQSRDMCASIRIAEKSGTTLEAIERPYLVFESLSGFQVRRDQAHRHYAEYTVANIGRTPALLDRLWADFHYDSAPPEPPSVFKFAREPILSNVPFGSGKSVPGELADLHIRGLNFLNNPTLMPNIDPGKSLYIVAFARYGDVSGNRHETGICRIYEMSGTDPWKKYGGSDYNYQT